MSINTQNVVEQWLFFYWYDFDNYKVIITPWTFVSKQKHRPPRPPKHCTMGVFNQILQKSQNLIFGYLGLLEFYCVVKTWNLNRNEKITLKNGFGCLKHVSKVRSKHKFCPFFMYFTIRLRYKNTSNSFSSKL